MGLFSSTRNTVEHELPVLRMGLAGFSAEEEQALARVMRQMRGPARWEFTALPDADVWCVNGARVTPLPDGTVRIAPGLPSGRSLRIDLHDVGWPVAICSPPATVRIEGVHTFDPQRPESVQAMLSHFEGLLQPLIVQLFLASRMVEMELDLRSSMYQVRAGGRLCAVVGMRDAGIGVCPRTDPAALPEAMWIDLPQTDEDMPADFIRTDLSRLMWQYGLRTQRDCLPGRYRISPIYLRRPPRLPVRMLDDNSLVLVRELGKAPGTFADLQKRTGFSEDVLGRHLAALYLVGSVTANPSRVPARRSALDSDSSAFGPHSGTGPELTVRLTAPARPGMARDR